LNRNGALVSCFDAFSSREPVSTSLENALVPFDAFSSRELVPAPRPVRGRLSLEDALAAFRASQRARYRFKARSDLGATTWSAREAAPAISPLTTSNAKSGKKYSHMTPASFFTGAPPGSVGRKQNRKSPVRRRRGPENPCARSSAHAKPLWFTRSRWTQE
jgi:hypothetical protein